MSGPRFLVALLEGRRAMSDPRNEAAGPDGELPEMFELYVTTRPELLQDFFKRFDVDVGCRHAHTISNKDGSRTVLVYATDRQIREIEAEGFAIKRGENVSALGRERQSEVGKGDRFDGGRTFPEGLGKLVRDQNGGTAS